MVLRRRRLDGGQIRVYPRLTRPQHLRNDKKIKAGKVGKRRSKSGNIYYERRENRTDVNRRRRL